MKSLDTEYETLALDEPTPDVVVVTLNRPDRYDAMTNTMFGELERLALDLDHEHGCRVVVLTGAGKAFSSATTSPTPRSCRASARWGCWTSKNGPPRPCSRSGACGFR
jgi:1,4-dihydroxy-2-naphthoyl-CoA synthase